MIKLVATLNLFCFYLSVNGQYYFKDVVSSKQASADMRTYKENKVKNIKIKSFESDGSASEGFFAERRIAKDYRKSELVTRSGGSARSLLTSIFDAKGNLIQLHDSSEIATTRTIYTYDEDDRLQKIATSLRSADDDFVNEILEEHIYTYGEEFLPVKMARVKNKFDTTTILFMLDENNNISIEKDTKSGSKYYYYYDEKSRLTDVAHSNEFKPRLVADYVFAYNTVGSITQMTTTEEASNNYFIWKYTYDEGLRQTERLYGTDRKLLGTIEYTYD